MRGGVIYAQTNSETCTFTSEFQSASSVNISGTDYEITIDKGTGSTNPTWNNNDSAIRVYAKGSIEISSTTKTIYQIKFNISGSKTINASNLSSNPTGFDTSSTTWTSSNGSNKIKLSIGGNSGHIKLKSIEIIYLDTDDPSKTATKLSFGEDYDDKTITKYIGDANTYSTPATLSTKTDPATTIDGAEIKYTSSNTDLVSVDESGNIKVVSTSETGTAKITAEYAGDDTYAESSASYIVEVKKQETALSFGTEYDNQTITKTTDDPEFTIPATLTPSIEGAEITYSSSNKSVAEVDNTGKVTLQAKAGTATITANFAGNDTYAATTASYDILVKNVGEEVAIFDFSGTNDYGSGVEKTTNSSHYETTEHTWTSGNVTMVTSGKYRWWSNTGGLRFYGGSFTLTAPKGYHFTNIELNGAYTFKSDNGTYTNTNGKWSGYAQIITFTSTTNGKDLTGITTTYEPDVTLTTAASSFATYACDYAVDYSTVGLEAYAITLNETEGTVAYKAIEGTTPAETAVLVKGDASTEYTLAPSTETAATVTTSLKISDGTVTAADNLYYGFATIAGVSGFKLIQNGITIPAKKGYLKLTNAMSNAKTFYAFDSEATGIEETFTKTETEKSFAPMFNISGQRVGDSYKGIVIVNGKKYVK